MAEKLTQCLPQCSAYRAGTCDLAACGGDDAWCRWLVNYDYPRFVERWENRVFGVIRLVIRNRDDAEDVLMKFWERVYAKRATIRWDEHDCVRPWLFMVARRLAIDWGEANPPDNAAIALPPNLMDGGGAIVDNVAIRDCLANLDPEERCMFQCRFIDQNRQSYCDQLCNLSHGTAHNRLKSAKAKMLQCLGVEP